MAFRTIDIAMPAGTCDAYVAAPDGPGPFPAVLFYMDVMGLRPELRKAIERIAAAGYYVLAPNLFYRLGRAPVADMAQLLKPENMPKVFEMVAALTPDIVVADAAGYLGFLNAQPEADAGKVATVGYCMGGGIALRTASHYPDQIAAAASFHGSFMGSEDPDSPHRTIDRAKGEIYVGLAAEDFAMPDDQIERLEHALKASGLPYRMETYPGTHHGFTLAGTPVYDPVQSERHWDALLALFDRSLKR